MSREAQILQSWEMVPSRARCQYYEWAKQGYNSRVHYQTGCPKKGQVVAWSLSTNSQIHCSYRIRGKGKQPASSVNSFFYMNKVLLNFIQLERTKKEEWTVLWKVGTRRAFPLEERACWGQCSCKYHTGIVSKAERMCMRFPLNAFSSLPTSRFQKQPFFPQSDLLRSSKER